LQALAWLAGKVDTAERVLKAQRVAFAAQAEAASSAVAGVAAGFTAGGSAAASSSSAAAAAAAPTTAARRAAVQVVCEYLDDGWAAALLAHIGAVPAGADAGATDALLFDRKDGRDAGESAPARAKWESVVEDDAEIVKARALAFGGAAAGKDGAGATKKRAAPAQSQGQKKLAKVNTKGMKSMMSFFGAKKK